MRDMPEMMPHTTGSLYSYNKHFEFLPDYYGRPFVWHDIGYNFKRYKQVRQPWLMWGKMIFHHKDMIGMMWWPYLQMPVKPMIRVYDREQFMYHLPISYGYDVGDTVKRVTDGNIFEITHINWSPSSLFSRTPDILPTGSLTYDLFIPLEDDRTGEYDPMEQGRWEGLFDV